MIPRAWVSLDSGDVEELPERVVAFCGVGNAGSFWRSLERMGVATLDQISYSDHHQYPPRELAALVRHAKTLGAEALVTTEKDVVNFGAGSEQVLEGMKVYWLRIDVEIENEAEQFRQGAVTSQFVTRAQQDGDVTGRRFIRAGGAVECAARRGGFRGAGGAARGAASVVRRGGEGRGEAHPTGRGRSG